MSGFSVQPSGQQTMSMAQVDAFLQEARLRATTKNPPVFGYRLQRMIQEKNNGYPKHMYHEKLEMRVVTKEEEEMALREIGYSDRYIPQEYPKWLHRRNMDPKFEPRFNPASGALESEPWVESRQVRTAEEEKMLRNMQPKRGQSPWCTSIADLPPIPDAPDEDPAVTIAHLKGQLEALQAGAGANAGDSREKRR